MGNALGQAGSAYTSIIGGVMPMADKVNVKVVLSDKEKENLHYNLKTAIFRDLKEKDLISDMQLKDLLDKAPKFLN